MTESKAGGAGLRGQVAGETALCTVDEAGAGLSYRGYDIQVLAEKAQFEEVAYLLQFGKLPDSSQLKQYKQRLKLLRQIPRPLKEVLERIPANSHPMDVMRTACSFLGNLETEESFTQQDEKIERMLAIFPSVICYWYHFSHNGVHIDTDSLEDSIAGYFLELMNQQRPSELLSRAMNASLILYAEHEFNASTFTARVCASTLSDIHSCVTAAIGTLRGPLHGGANEEAMAMIEQWQNPDEAEAALLDKLAHKEKVMGFGHAVYKKSDPRNAIIKKWAEKLAQHVGDTRLYPVSVRCEEVMWREKKLFPNADFFHACAYHFMGIPTRIFTPLFVMSRVTGWTAHIKEQRANNRIIRPSADYTGPESAAWLDIEDR
ncbi:MAG: 2-methylcitrate synthase [Pseudohongiellaceae bacterium]